MEAPEPTCPGPSARDKPALAPGLSGTPRGQASPHLTLGPVILPQEQNLPPTVFLKALPIPLYHTVPPGGLQPRAPLVTGSLDGGSVPFILSPLLQPEGPGPTQVGKPAAPTLTVNIVGALPVLSPGLAPTLGSPGKVRNAGKYLCPHCGRDCLKPSVLEKHIRSHTGERPFPCATCGIAFKTQSNLYKHRRTQTHLNNSRLSLESERGRHSLLDEGDRVREPSTADGTGENQNQGTPETALSPGPHLSLAAKNLEMKTEATPNPDSTLVHREGPVDSTQIASPLASSQPRRKLPEQKPCSLPRQQGMTLEKPWDSRASEGRLRKCESTDSGYLSRSDSAEQPPVPSSPLHSLSEHSVESEGEGGPGPGLGGARAESGAPGASLELEKKQLEERIARLISHNQAVVDDPQLDHVRPRKTVLSKQGSIDLPMPYTYKDSFHFDIRALEPGRRRAALCPARSTFTPLDKARPLFFHSVPTQLSTMVECVPVTRSNSLPFVEGSRTWPEPRDLQDACPRLQKPLSPRLAPTRVGYHSGLTLADVPSGHPRALVRQAAVEDVPCVPTGDTSAPAEDLDGKKTPAGDGAASKSRVASKKTNQRKLKMFSQEKWQVYGNETFERIYQKMKSSHQGGQKARKVRAGHETELNLPHQEEVAGGKGVTLSQESKTLILGDISVEDKPWRSLPAPEDSWETESPQQKKTVAGTGDTDQLRVARPESSPTLSSRVPHHLGSRSPQFPPKGRMEPGCQLPPSPRPLQREDLGDSRLILTDPKLERGLPSGGSVKETCPWAQPVLRRPSGGSGEPQSLEDKLPSERKKLKVEGLDPQEQLRLLGTETAGGSVQAASLPSQKQDGDPQEMPGGPPEDALPVAAPLESSCTSPATAAVLKQEGPRDKEPRLPPAARAPGHHVQLATQPQPPSDLTAVADSTFPPKYLLRLPQGETPPQLPISRGQGQDSLCTSGQPEQRRVSLVGSEPGTSQSLSPASGPTSGETDRILDPSWSRPSDGREEAQAGKEKAQVSVPATKDSPGSATGVPQETASFLSVCNAHVVRDPGDATHAIHDLCTDRILTRARTSGDLLNPWSPTWELGQPLESALEVPSMEPLAGLNVSCPFQPGSFLPAPMGPQGMALGRTELAPARHLGTPRSCRAQSSFPSLRAEPRLTWCCLSRSLPLPVEQKDKTASVYSALHFPGDSLQDEGPSILPFSSGGRTRTSPGGGGPVQTPELSYPTVPGMRAQDPVLDPERKKGLCRRRVKTSRGDSRQKKLRLHPKRCEGSFWQSRAQLRVSRLRKPPWVPRRRCLPSPLHGPEPRGTLRRASLEVAGLSLRGEPSCASAELSLGHGNEERKEDNGRSFSEAISPSASSKTVREMNKSTVKGISPSAGKHDDCFLHEDTAGGPRLSLPSDSCLTVAKADPLPLGEGLDFGLLDTQRLPSQNQVSIDPKPCISSDSQEPSSFGFKGTFPHHDVSTSVAAICITLGARAGHTTLGIHSVEAQDHNWAAGETLIQSSPDRGAIAESTAQILLPEKLSPGQKIWGLAPLGSPGKTHLEPPASGPSSTSSHQEERRHQTGFLSNDQYGCEEMATPCPALGSDNGECQASGLITQRGYVFPSNPGQASEVSEAPSPSIRKRSLEGMRKQTRVELSDSSSDDEDRLIIEL